jgi:hypothetical protein
MSIIEGRDDMWGGTGLLCPPQSAYTINPVPWYHKTDNRFLGTYAEELVYENLVGNNPNPVFIYNKTTQKYAWNSGFKWNFSGVDSKWYTITKG